MITQKNSVVFGISLIIVFTIFAYFPVIQHGGYNWDDNQFVFEKPSGLHGLLKIWTIGGTQQYYPLVFTTFWLESYLWGRDPTGYHIVNVLFHLLNAILLWRVLRRLQVPGAWLAAILFAIHPVHTESVAWISERKNVLSGFFYFLSLLSYLRFVEREKFIFYIISFGLFACALLSKTVTFSLPVIILLLLWFKRKSITLRDCLLLIPYLLIGLLAGFGTTHFERELVGAKGNEWHLTFIDRVLIAGRAIWFYWSKLTIPVNLTFSYERWVINSKIWWQYLFPIFSFLLPFWLWIKRTTYGKGPLIAVLFFYVTIFPALGFFDIYPMRFTFVADHYQYLASLGPLVLFASALQEKMGVGAFSLSHKKASAFNELIIGALLIACAVLTWDQSRLYKSEETIWLDTLKKNPKAWIAQVNLGSDAFFRKKFDQAIHHYQEALKLKPEYSKVYANIGAAYTNQKKYDEAIRTYEEGLKLDPNHTGLLINMGIALDETHRSEEALQYFTRALEIDPKSVPGHINLAIAYRELKNFDGAIREFKEALRLDPDMTDIQYKLAEIYETMGDKHSAGEIYSLILEKMPSNPRILSRTGNILYRWGMLNEGIEAFQKAVELNPNDQALYKKIGIGLSVNGKKEEAKEYLIKAIQMNFNDADSLFELGNILDDEGDLKTAERFYRAAIKIDPKNPTFLNNLGLNLGKQEQYDQAILQFTKAIQLKNDFTVAHTNLEMAKQKKDESEMKEEVDADGWRIVRIKK